MNTSHLILTKSITTPIFLVKQNHCCRKRPLKTFQIPLGPARQHKMSTWAYQGGLISFRLPQGVTGISFNGPILPSYDNNTDVNINKDIRQIWLNLHTEFSVLGNTTFQATAATLLTCKYHDAQVHFREAKMPFLLSPSAAWKSPET